MNNNPISEITELKKMGLKSSFAIYLPAAALMFIFTRYLIPWPSKTTGQEIILFWFIVAGLGIFLPLIITGILILKSEGYKLSNNTWKKRLRFRKPEKADWVWALAALVVAGTLSGMIMIALELFSGPFDHSPPFMAFEPLNPERLVTDCLVAILDSKHFRRRIYLERRYATPAGKSIWKKYLAYSRNRLEFVSYHLWLATVTYPNSTHFYSFVDRPENKKFMGGSYYSRRIERAKFSGHFF